MIYSEDPNIPQKRSYKQIELEINNIVFMALNWTVVHPINEKSPLYGLNFAEIQERNLEFMILVSGIDDTFDQTIYQKYAYSPKDLLANQKWVKMYDYNESGFAEIDFDKLNQTEKIS